MGFEHDATILKEYVMRGQAKLSSTTTRVDLLTEAATTSQSRTSYMLAFIDMTWLKDDKLAGIVNPAERQAYLDQQHPRRDHVGTHPDIIREYVEHEGFKANARYILANILDARNAGIQQIAMHVVCRANRHRCVAGGLLLFELACQIKDTS